MWGQPPPAVHRAQLDNPASSQPSVMLSEVGSSKGRSYAVEASLPAVTHPKPQREFPPRTRTDSCPTMRYDPRRISRKQKERSSRDGSTGSFAVLARYGWSVGTGTDGACCLSGLHCPN